MTRINSTEARKDISTVINRVAFGKEHVILNRRGKDLAAVIPMEDYILMRKMLEEAEDIEDIAEAERRLADPNEIRIPFEKAVKELGKK